MYSRSGGRLGNFTDVPGPDAGRPGCDASATGISCDAGRDASMLDVQSLDVAMHTCEWTGATDVIAVARRSAASFDDAGVPDAAVALPTLWFVDPTTGAAFSAGEISCDGGESDVLSVTADAFGVAWIVASRPGVRELWRVSALDASCLGTTTLTGASAPADGEAMSIAFAAEPTTPGAPIQLWGVISPTGSRRLVTIDPATGAVTTDASFTESDPTTRIYLQGNEIGLASLDVTPDVSAMSSAVAFGARNLATGVFSARAAWTLDDSRFVAGGGAIGASNEVVVLLRGDGVSPDSSALAFDVTTRATRVVNAALPFVPYVAGTSVCQPVLPPM
jgi:hypothetical protein